MKLGKVDLTKGIFGGSLVLLVTINLFFILNYFFHFAMARMLSIENYGVLVALYSIIYILAIFTESIQLVISKYATKEKDDGKLKNIIARSSKKGLKYSLYIFMAYLLVSIFLSSKLQIDYILLAFTGLMIFGSFLMPITRGVLQGRKRFKGLGFNMISEALFKLVFAVILVLIGWAVYGAILATLIGVYASIALSFVSIKDIISKKEKKTTTPGIYAYTAPTFVLMVTIILFYSVDVLIAKAVFTPTVAGYYAIMSIIAKVIFFGTMPISKALFPITAESKTKKESEKIILKAFTLIGVLIAIALLIVYFLPDLLIRIFAGRYIPEIEGILIFPAIAISLVSLANLNILNKLSLGKVKGAYYLLIFVAILIALLSYFSANILQFSLAFIVASAAFLWGSITFLNE